MTDEANGAGVVRVVGKVAAVREHEGQYFTMIQLPPVAVGRKPEMVEVRSNRKIAEQSQTADVRCQVGGFNRKPFRYTDLDTGEARTGRQNVVTLSVVGTGA